MRGVFLFFLALGLVGCGRSLGPSEAAVHVQASYDFKAGCISVEAHDKDAPEKSKTENIVVSGRPPPAKVDLAVFRAADWGSKLAITVSARERRCDGPVVASETQEYDLKEASVQELEVLLSAPDVDGDTYVDASHGGTDCDDSHREINPGVTTELCDGLDNDCRNGVDDGLPFSDFYRDEDGDHVGAGTPVRACAAPPGYAAEGGDCDDHDATRAPGKAELCDDVDDNCNNQVDESLLTQAWYRDADGDTFGTQSDMVQKCKAPAGYVAATATFDCNDADPNVKPGATELCNGVDDNCVGGIDENFTQKGQSCSNSGCPGTYICNASQNATVCDAPAPVSYYPDLDGDGEGSATAGAENICPPAAAPAGKVTNHTDCDDLDLYNKLGGTEVCDDRDNNCSNGKADEAAVCNGKGWKPITMPTAGRGWKTVALGAGGSPVWVAGSAGALAYRADSNSGSFTEFHQKCGNVTWVSSWVRPSDGTVFLAGSAGNLAAYTANAATCVTANTTTATGGMTSNRLVTGIIGFESAGVTTLYAANDQGYVFSWTGDTNAPVFLYRRSALDPYWDLHAASPSKLLLAAEAGADVPQIDSYDPGTNTRVVHAFANVPGGNYHGLHGIWAWDSTHAFAVGNKGNFVAWDGNTTWYFFSPDPNMKVDLNSVTAVDAWSAYIVGQDGKVRRPSGAGWVEHYSASGGTPLEDIASSSRQNIWAVGNGIVVHFPE